MAYHPEIKEQLDPRLLPWPGVTSRKMFGAICYLYQDRMFAFITRDSVVTKLPLEERERALKHHGALQFLISQGIPFGQWTEFPASDPEALDTVIPWIERGYSYVQLSPPTRRSGQVRSKPKSLGVSTG